MPTVTALPVKQSNDAREILRADLENENDTVRAYRDRVRKGDLATAPGEEVPDVSARR